ncbi:MAG TPA: hypothetical protein VFN92_08225 [Solirubrobacterales bacterium]|nr:hypothetical protein [Solirubrobacterales bacterium]
MEEMDPSPMGLLDRRQDRLEGRIEELEAEVEKVAALESQLNFLREGFNRNTNTMYQAGIAILATGVIGLVTALILKGVIG